MAKYIALDTEYDKNNRLLTVGVADTKRAKSYDRDLLGVGFKTQIFKSAAWLAGHSLSGDIDQLVKVHLAKKEWVDGRKTLDSLLLARMVDENRLGYDLETLLCSGHQVNPWKYKTEAYSKTDASLWPAELRAERCRLDAWASAVLVEELAGKVPVAIRTFTHQVAMVIHRILLAGAFVDLKAFEEMGQSLGKDVHHKADLLKRAAYKTGMKEFSPTNYNHIRELLYKRLNLRGEQKTKSGKLSVDRIALKQHADQKVVKLLMEYNRIEKQYSTWYGHAERTSKNPPLKGLIETIGPGTGRLQFRINPLGARTGRRSSSAPNSQNWPKAVRSIIKSRWKNGLIGDFDYEKLEPNILGWCAPEPLLLEYFGKGGPGYIGIARDIFNRKVEKDTPDYRVAKAIVLGTHYGAQAFKIGSQLWYDLGIKLSGDWEDHIEATAKLREKYLGRFPGVKVFMRNQRKAVIQRQCVVSPTGRVRHLPCPDGEETPGFGHLVNQAINFPIQSMAADVTGSALIDVENCLTSNYGYDIIQYHQMLLERQYPKMPLLINEVHDDLVFDLPGSLAKDATKLIVETMREVPTLRRLCPEFNLELNVDASVSPRWGKKED